ncbi:unnamed protein product, partial [Symbiodinium microadriaticum]
MVVAELLQWDAPIALILLVLLTRFNDRLTHKQDYDYVEIFAGAGEVSAKLREETASLAASAASSSMAPASSKPASKKKASVDDCAAESQRKLNASLNASLARGKALKNLQKNAAYDLTTPILPGTCDVTLGELMQTEKLSLPDAVQVMLKFRKDAAITDPDEVGLSLPPAKPGASKPKHEPKHDELSPPKGILKKGKSRLDAEPPQDDDDDDDDVHGHAAVKKASSKRKPDAKGSEPKVPKGKAKPKRGSSFEDLCLSEPAPSSPASNPKKKAKKPEPEPTPASNPTKKAKKPEPDHQDEEPEEGAPSTELENSKQQKKKKPQNKPPAPEEKEPEGEGSSPASSKNSSQKKKKKKKPQNKPPAPEEKEPEGEGSSPASSKNSSQKKKKPQNKPPVPEEKEPEGEARASKKEEAVEASTNNRGKKRTKSKTFNRSHAKEDLAEGTAKEAASKGHDGDEGSADYQADLQEMIDEIDRAPKDTKDSKWPKDWPHDAQPNLLAEGWSCSSLALGEEQMDATNPATDPAELETQVNGSQTVTELIESLGASASQVGANGDYSHLLGLLNNLKLQIENPKPSPGSATTGAEKEGGGKADKEGEGKTDKEGEGKAEQEYEGEAEQEYEGEAEQEYEGEAEQEYEGEEWNDDSWNEGEEEEYGQDEDQEEQAESEELMSNQESAKRVLQEGKDAKDSGGLASRPVATPARSLDAIIQKLKPVPAGEPKEPNPEPAQLARDVPSGTPSAAAAPASDEQKINSTTHKKEYMRAGRIAEKMGLQWRDRDAPGIHEETKYWVTIEETAEDSVNVQHKQQFSAQAAATAAAAHNILSAPIEPTMMSRPSAEIKKEAGALAGLLMELPEGDELREELEGASAKLNKFRDAKTAAEMKCQVTVAATDRCAAGSKDPWPLEYRSRFRYARASWISLR